jgi:hypothetical protein
MRSQERLPASPSLPKVPERQGQVDVPNRSYPLIGAHIVLVYSVAITIKRAEVSFEVSVQASSCPGIDTRRAKTEVIITVGRVHEQWVRIYVSLAP